MLELIKCGYNYLHPIRLDPDQIDITTDYYTGQDGLYYTDYVCPETWHIDAELMQEIVLYYNNLHNTDVDFSEIQKLHCTPESDIEGEITESRIHYPAYMLRAFKKDNLTDTQRFVIDLCTALEDFVEKMWEEEEQIYTTTIDHSVIPPDFFYKKYKRSARLYGLIWENGSVTAMDVNYPFRHIELNYKGSLANSIYWEEHPFYLMMGRNEHI